MTPAGPSRTAQRVPWILFLVELVITSAVVGVLSGVLVAQLTLIPGAIFGEYDGIFTWAAGLGVTGAVEIGATVLVFFATGLIVGILGLPIRLIGPVRRAWLGNGEVTLAGVAAGVVLILVAYLLGTWSRIRLEQHAYDVFTPHPWLLLVGWLLLALSLSLLVWPARWLPRHARAWWAETQLTKGGFTTAIPPL